MMKRVIGLVLVLAIVAVVPIMIGCEKNEMTIKKESTTTTEKKTEKVE